MKVYIPQFIVEIYQLRPAFESLKDSARRSAVLFGFIISALGGTLHLSYPPTLEECQLYFEVITLYEHYGVSMGEIIPTFAHVLDSLLKPKIVLIPPQVRLIDDLVEFAWLMCSQSRTCLALLAPFYESTEASSKLLERFGHLTSLDPTRFIELVQWKWCKKPWKLPRYHDIILPTLYSVEDGTFPSHFIDYARDAFCRREFANSALVQFDNTDSAPIPPHLFGIASSLVDKNGEKSGKRHLVHKALLMQRWPYFKALFNSGLSESKSHLAELPLSEDTIKWLIKAIYVSRWANPSHESIIELLENGPQFGLFDALVLHEDNTITATNVSPTFQSVIGAALRVFGPVSPFHSSDQSLNASHRLGLHDFWKRRLDSLRTEKYPPNFARDFPNLHPEIVAAAEAILKNRPST